MWGSLVSLSWFHNIKNYAQRLFMTLKQGKQKMTCHQVRCWLRLRVFLNSDASWNRFPGFIKDNLERWKSSVSDLAWVTISIVPESAIPQKMAGIGFGAMTSTAYNLRAKKGWIIRRNLLCILLNQMMDIIKN